MSITVSQLGSPVCAGICIAAALDAAGILKSIFATQLQADNISFIALLFNNLILSLASGIKLICLVMYIVSEKRVANI
jgi:hypothetical protein